MRRGGRLDAGNILSGTGMGKKALLDQRLDLLEQVLTLKVRTWPSVRKSAALIGPCRMDCAPLSHPVRSLEDAGTVLLHHKSVPVLQVPFPDLSIGYAEMSTDAIDIHGGKQQHSAFQSVAAVAWTIIAVDHYPAMDGLLIIECSTFLPFWSMTAAPHPRNAHPGKLMNNGKMNRI